MRDSGFTRGTGGTAVHQTRYITREPAIPNPGLLIRTWTRYSEPGQPRPHAEQRVYVRDALESKSLSRADDPSRIMG